jgi:hypothetical protein
MLGGSSFLWRTDTHSGEKDIEENTDGEMASGQIVLS